MVVSTSAILPARAMAQSPLAPAVADASTLPASIESIVVRDTIQSDGSSERTTEVSVALRDTVAVSQFGQIGMPYIEGYGEVFFDSIVVDKTDGRRIEVPVTATEDLNPFGMSANPVPADIRFRRLTVPGLSAGDRLSYRIRLRQKALFPDVIFGEFKFIAGPFAERQVYELDIPATLRLSLRTRSELEVDWEEVTSPPERRVRRLTLTSPIEMPEAEDAAILALGLPDVELTTFASWDETARWWWAMSHERFSPDDAVRAEASRLTVGTADTRGRVEALHSFVRGQIRYLNVGFGSGRYEPRPASEVLSTRYGDCKGKHALFAALGAAVGIEVRPALVHSFREVLHDDVPSPGQFDHLVSVVGDGDPSEWLWIDTTGELAPPGYLPPNLRGKRALLIDEDGGRVVTIPEELPFETRVAVEARGSLDEAGPLRAEVRWTARGDLELMLRAAIIATPRESWNDFGKALAGEWTKGVVSAVEAGDAFDVQQPFWIQYAVEHSMTSNSFTKDWGFWVPLPRMDLPEAAVRGGIEPLAELASPDETVYRARVELPEGMEARAPLSVTLERPFASYRSTYSVDGRRLNLERVLEVRRRKISADESAAYEAFRRAVDADYRQEFSIEAFGAPVAEVLETADQWNDAGNRALDRNQFEEAAELLRKAVEKDPGHKWAWNNLGRALRGLDEPEEALKAFDRQIEINPYDPYAYHNRGATLLFVLKRSAEAERDFLKQIEVAPFEHWAYRDLASLRTTQGRFDEAGDLLERAIAAKPSEKELWLALVWARARAGRSDTVAAAERAIEIDGRPRPALVAARAVAASGGLQAAARIAAAKLPALLSSLDSSSAKRLDSDEGERDLLFVAEAWRLRGISAAGEGDLSSAERYLIAAWELGGTPDAAVDLGRLRERQGRHDEALAVWQQASFLPLARGNPARRELERVVHDPARVEELTSIAPMEMAKRQVQELPGPAVERVEVRVRLLVDQSGRVLEVQPRKPEDMPKLKPLRDRVLKASLPAPNPDRATFKLVRGATVTCFSEGGCSLGLDLYGNEVESVLER